MYAHYCTNTIEAMISNLYIVAGIFSPLEEHSLSVGKVTASVAPTVRATPIDTRSHPSVHQASVTKSDYVAGMSGLFSPIDSHTVITPHHVAGRGNTSQSVAMKANSVEHGHVKHEVADTASQQGQQPARLHVVAMESTIPAVDDKGMQLSVKHSGSLTDSPHTLDLDLVVLSHEDTSVRTSSDTASQAISTSSIHHSDVQTSSMSTFLSSTQEAIAAGPPRDRIVSEEKVSTASVSDIIILMNV